MNKPRWESDVEERKEVDSAGRTCACGAMDSDSCATTFSPCPVPSGEMDSLDSGSVRESQ